MSEKHRSARLEAQTRLSKSWPTAPQPGTKHLTTAQLDSLIAQATVDAYGESEQRVGFFTMLEDHLVLPFETEVLGASAVVERLDLDEDERIVAVCRRGRLRQRIAVLDLPLPEPPPEGAQWIEAYRRWARGR